MGSGNKENRPEAPLRTPPKQALPAEPWTPTANLKVLIRAASPEIRSRERSRCQEHPAGDGRGRAQAARREKSLGSLCHRLLARYPDYPSAEESYYICLDEAAEELKFERRRIYDIVHVLESLHMVSRLAQNRYIWHGRHNLAKTLQALKKAGEENKYTLLIETIKKREHKDEFGLDGKRSEEAVRSARTGEHSERCCVELPGMEFPAGKVPPLSYVPLLFSPLEQVQMKTYQLTQVKVLSLQQSLGISWKDHQRIKSANPNALHETTAREGDICTAAADPGKATADKERWESSSKRCLKRSQALQESNLIKKHRSNEESLDSAMDQAVFSHFPFSVPEKECQRVQTNCAMESFQGEKQNRPQTLDQSVASSSDQHKMEHAPENEDRTKTGMAFAVPARETFFPSGYLIPLTQCTHHSNKACLLNRENTGMCSLQHPSTYSSPTAGVIPMTASELTAVNVPAFQITSLNITLTPTSIATAPVLSNPCLNSDNIGSVPNPSYSLLNFALQHGRLIPAGGQAPPNPVLQHIPTPLKPESINRSSQNVTLQEKVRNSGLQLLHRGQSRN
ncbi:hypothetical protein ASZ78_010097 [Callipepla squamata]|uniref:Transcription factor E2F8 n=1 Tax=Callipepla squamata TaxID=9009 RepID=A0A226MW82_CALSU|nr:hypothetical protein ASZ78_010097 [Callipepla squamata]